MTVLVLGAPGFIGRPIIACLKQLGYRTVAASRHGQSSAADISVEIDRTDTASLVQAVRTHRVEQVVDVIAYTERDTLPVIKALEHEIDHYVLISSADVYRNYGVLYRLENGAVDGLLTESSALRTSRFPYRLPTPRQEHDPQSWMDHYDKIPLEDAVRSATFAATILRLPMVYGPGDKHHRFKWMIDAIERGKPTVTVPSDWLNWVTTYGYVENVAAAVATSVHHPTARNETFNVVDTPPKPHADWLRRVADHLGAQIEIVPDEDAESPFAANLRHLDLSAPLALDGSKLRTALGFEPPVSLADSIKATITFERRLQSH